MSKKIKILIFIFSIASLAYAHILPFSFWKKNDAIPCPGSLTYSTAGTYSFTVPANCVNLTVRAWGAGGGGGGDGSGAGAGGAGGNTVVNGTIIANGGTGGQSSGTGVNGTGGSSSGGDFNKSGRDGSPGTSGSSGAGGDTWTSLKEGALALSSSGSGLTGNNGGGGSGGMAGGGLTGGGGGGGGFAQGTLTVTPGQTISVVIGTGGSVGAGAGGGGRGGDGKVILDFGPTGFNICGGSSSTIGIGVLCGGGVFYVGHYNGYKYMVMPTNCDTLNPPTCDNSQDAYSYLWGFDGVTTGATSTTDGVANTALLAGGPGPGRICNDLSYGGYTDWFLPAKEEVIVLYTVRSSYRAFFYKDIISSTETSSTTYTSVNTETGVSTTTTLKGADKHLRCMRRF